MQLTRVVVSVALLVLAHTHGVDAQAAGEVDASSDVKTLDASGGVRTSIYVDSDHTTIVTASTDATARVAQRWQVGAHYLLDVVSSASIDVVTQASVSFDDVRHEMGASAGYRSDDGTALVGSYSHSTENDWQSHNFALSSGVDVLDRNLSLALSLGFQDNTITRSDTFGFEEKLRTYLGTASATYTATPRDLLHFALSLSHYDGFQASPYRYLTVRQFGYAEVVPEQRTRVALVGRHHRHLGSDLFLRSHARLYTDSFGVSALTAGTELYFERDALDLSGFVRGYTQSSADFYQGVYSDPERYMTLDKELSTFWDVFVGGAAGWTFRDPVASSFLRFEARVAGNYFHFIDFVRLSNRFGLTATLAISGQL